MENEDEPPVEAIDAPEEVIEDPPAEDVPEPEPFDPLGDDVPEWMSGAFDGRGDDVKMPTREEMSALPIEQQYVVHAIRARALADREKQTVAEQKLEDKLRVMEDERLALRADRTSMNAFFKDPKFEKFFALDEDEAPEDLHSEEGIRRAVDKAARSYTQQLFAAINEKSTAEEASFAEEQKVAARAVRMGEIKEFAAAHSDFRDHWTEIKELVETTGIRAERAYTLVKAEKGLATTPLTNLTAVQKSRIRAQAGSNRGGGGASGTKVKITKDMSAAERAQIIQDNPDFAAELERERLRN